MPPEPDAAAALAREAEALQAAFAARPDDLPTLNNLACCRLGLGQVDEALNLLEGAALRWGGDACLLNNLGFARLRAGRRRPRLPSARPSRPRRMIRRPSTTSAWPWPPRSAGSSP